MGEKQQSKKKKKGERENFAFLKRIGFQYVIFGGKGDSQQLFDKTPSSKKGICEMWSA